MENTPQTVLESPGKSPEMFCMNRVTWSKAAVHVWKLICSW